MLSFRSLLYITWCVILFAPKTAFCQTVYHVDMKLDGMIDTGVSALAERTVELANSEKAAAIIFEIDTFGGRVDAATVIRDAILDSEVMTIAFINKRAISAGALISLACDEIVMTEGGTMGATTPVDGAGTKASDKVTSYMRAEMRATAEKTGRNPKIAEAMVDERVDIPGLSAEAGRPATLTTEQALNYEMVDETAESLEDVLLMYELNGSQIINAELNWAEHIVRILTHPVVTSILLGVATFGLIAEVRTPGWGLGGTLALVALGLFFGSHLVVKLAEWEELALFAVGIGLIIIEVIAIPGFGFVGLVGAGLVLGSVVITQLGNFELWTFDEIASVIARLCISMICAFAFSLIALRSLPKWSAFNRLVLKAETRAKEGYVSSSREEDDEWLGREGTTLSELRPAGIAVIQGKRLDVVTDGEFVAAQQQVKIVEARGNRIVVRPVTN